MAFICMPHPLISISFVSFAYSPPLTTPVCPSVLHLQPLSFAYQNPIHVSCSSFAYTLLICIPHPLICMPLTDDDDEDNGAYHSQDDHHLGGTGMSVGGGNLGTLSNFGDSPGIWGPPGGFGVPQGDLRVPKGGSGVSQGDLGCWGGVAP